MVTAWPRSRRPRPTAMYGWRSPREPSVVRTKWLDFKTAILRQHQLAAAPDDCLAEESEHPGDETRDVFERQQPPVARDQRIVVDPDRGRPLSGCAEEQGQQREAPRGGCDDPEDEGECGGFREEFAQIADAARTPGAAGPAQAVLPVFQ